MKNLPDKYFTIDDSLSLINRTGAFYIARELVESFADLSRVRRWRFFWNKSLTNNWQRKVCAKLMLREIKWLKDDKYLNWPNDKNSAFTLYLDPLYVLRNQLTQRDIVLCHDIGPITNPHLNSPETAKQYQKAYQKIVKAKCGVVFVSEHSKEAFINAFGADFRFLEAIPLYLRSRLIETAPQELSQIKRPFFLSVGGLEVRKNHALTIRAFQQGKFYDQGYQLIICGSKGDAHAEIKSLSEKVPGVKLLGYVTNAQLCWLYQNAEIFILASHYEGFGMPALEAAYFGLPLVISKNSALEEAVSGNGITVDSLFCSEIVSGINTVLGLSALQKAELVKRLKQSAKERSQTKFLEHWHELIYREINLN